MPRGCGSSAKYSVVHTRQSTAPIRRCGPRSIPALYWTGMRSALDATGFLNEVITVSTKCSNTRST
jgi:hypothetical protein